ncbi:SAF domain-containing protein [Kocuria palustris]|uniref:SAF domain-containing protein n=1 Tax=Kocuria palustris TaxID=71999 RepID=UPI0019595F48|nr:SAF domain-containing protein [Kocuria palustris]MBM7822444.1 Flp pilus assembly protein CpaB [Kocuria palustris]
MTIRRGSAPSPGRRARLGGRGTARRRPRSAPRRPRYPLGITLRTALSRRRRLIAAVLLSIAAAIAVLQISPASQRTVPTVVAARSLGAGTALSPDDLRVADYPVDLVPGESAAGAEDTAAPDDQGSSVGTRQPSTDPLSTPTEGLAADAAGESPGADQQIETWVGRTLASAVVEGQPLTGPSVLGPDLLSGQPPGTTAVTLRVADSATLTHVRPGQHVDLIRSDADLPAPSPSAAADDRTDGDAADASEDGAEGSEQTGASETSARVAAQLPVLWVADPAEPADGLLASTPESQDDLLVVGADAATAERLAAAPEGELVPVLVAAPADAEALSPSAEAAGR